MERIKTDASDKEIIKKILSKKRAGVAFPLISLLHKNAYECGDIETLLIIKNWVKKTGLTIVQILPLNDTGTGKSPYSSISAFAIDPVYISLHKLGIKLKNRKETIATLKVNYTRMRSLKIQALRIHFETNHNPALRTSLEQFVKENKWVSTYVAFRTLYDKNQGTHWQTWQYGSKYSPKLEKEIITSYSHEYYFQVWMQYVAYLQLKEVKEAYAKDGLFLKGDMPILTSSNSADVWSSTHLFDLSITAGAPPDSFSEDGQNWAFPVINWEVMRKENYSWWEERLKYLENFYHLYRIDHVLGMYRIWSIPLNAKSARFGFFHPQHGTTREDFIEAGLEPEEFVKRKIIYEFDKDRYIFYWDFYKEKGYSTLSEDIKRVLFPLSIKHLKTDEAIWKDSGEHVLNYFFKTTSMLACAEDLGSVPGFVRDSIFENKIIGLDIIRWTRSFEDGSFIPGKGYRERAVSSLSVHDTSIILEWWKKELNPADKKSFAKLIGLPVADTEEEDEEEIEYSDKEVLEAMIKFALSTNSLFSINLLHDFLFDGNLIPEEDSIRNMYLYPEEHRINVPGTDETHNWSYRYPFFAENLERQEKLISKLKKFIHDAER